MKTTFVYLDIAYNPDYDKHTRQFVETYLRFPAGIEHELLVAIVGGDNHTSAKRKEIFSQLKCTFKAEPAEGWDITHHQSIARMLDCDFAVFCTSRTYFWRDGWLKRLVQTREEFGEGLYGTTGSYEVNPHLRTVFFGCHPQAIRDFPFEVDTRKKAGWFEAGKWNFTRRFGGKAYMVTWDAVYLEPDWRRPPNIFRRGDQSSMLVWDKHSNIYAAASPAKKKELENQADGLYRGWTGKFRHFFDRYFILKSFQ